MKEKLKWEEEDRFARLQAFPLWTCDLVRCLSVSLSSSSSLSLSVSQPLYTVGERRGVATW